MFMYVCIFGLISILLLGIISISCFLLMRLQKYLEIITGYLQEWVYVVLQICVNVLEGILVLL